MPVPQPLRKRLSQGEGYLKSVHRVAGIFYVQQDVNENKNEVGNIKDNHEVIIKPNLMDKAGKIAKPNYDNK